VRLSYFAGSHETRSPNQQQTVKKRQRKTYRFNGNCSSCVFNKALQTRWVRLSALWIEGNSPDQFDCFCHTASYAQIARIVTVTMSSPTLAYAVHRRSRIAGFHSYAKLISPDWGRARALHRTRLTDSANRFCCTVTIIDIVAQSLSATGG